MTTALVKHERSAIVAMYAGVALTVVATIVPYVDHATANVLADHIRAGYPTYTQARIDTAVTTYLVHHRSARRHLLVLDDPGRQRREAVGPRGRDRDVRARNRHRPARSPRQRHVRRHRPAAAAGVDRPAAVPRRVPSSRAAVDEIVIGTGQHSGAQASEDRADEVGCPVRANRAGPEEATAGGAEAARRPSNTFHLRRG